MNDALARTFELLAKTGNLAAVDVLVAALDSPHAEIHLEALRALLERKSQPGMLEIVRRLHRGGETWWEALHPLRSRLTHALRDGLFDADPQTAANACRAAARLRDYDLAPALVSILEDANNPHAQRAAETLLDLAEGLYTELTSPRDYTNRRDPQLVRRNVTAVLEQSVSRFNKHQRREVLEAFLLLAARDNCTLQQILLDPLHGSHTQVIDLLLHSPRPGVVRLLLSFLELSRPPSAALAAVARRSDPKFVQGLLRKLAHDPSPAASYNLKRIDSIPWLRPGENLLDTLDDAEQQSAVRLIAASGVKRPEVFQTLEHLLLHGTPGGRRAACEALTEFSGAEANALVLKALDDADPLVEAAAVRQLRQRGIPGALPRLIELVESSHEVVRSAVRDSLSEFQFQRFLATYDLLEPTVRASTAPLVKKIDPLSAAQLREEMESSARTRRLRAIEMAEVMQLLGETEGRLIELLQDDDHLVRTEAARVLGASDTPEAQMALRLALLDRSPMVQQTAQASLLDIAERLATRGPAVMSAGAAGGRS